MHLILELAHAHRDTEVHRVNSVDAALRESMIRRREPNPGADGFE